MIDKIDNFDEVPPGENNLKYVLVRTVHVKCDGKPSKLRGGFRRAQTNTAHRPVVAITTKGVF
jgi:hypothetical protein